MFEFKHTNSDGTEISIVINRSDLTISEIGYEFRAFLAAVGYHPENIGELFGEGEE